jgi:hypothetical protein
VADQYDSLLNDRPPRFSLAASQIPQLVQSGFEQIDGIAGDPGRSIGRLQMTARSVTPDDGGP